MLWASVAQVSKAWRDAVASWGVRNGDEKATPMLPAMVNKGFMPMVKCVYDHIYRSEPDDKWSSIDRANQKLSEKWRQICCAQPLPRSSSRWSGLRRASTIKSASDAAGSPPSL